jgi:hypothetical protein
MISASAAELTIGCDQPRVRDSGAERRVSAEGRREDAFPQEAKQLRVDIAGCLSEEGFWLGPRSVLVAPAGAAKCLQMFPFPQTSLA